jgi:hypothetical protein
MNTAIKANDIKPHTHVWINGRLRAIQTVRVITTGVAVEHGGGWTLLRGDEIVHEHTV